MAVLHTHSWGPADGEVVLAVHGVQNTGARIRRLAEQGLPELRVIAPDLRGHANSTWHPPWHAEQHVEDLLETLEALGVERMALLGHSFGGLLSTHLAAAVPERVTSVTLVDPAIALPPEMAHDFAEIVRRDEGWTSPEEARAARLALRPPHAADTVDEDLRVFLRRDPDGRYRFAYSRSAVVTAFSEMARPPANLHAVTVPVLVVTALQAEFVTDALRARLLTDLGDRVREVGIDAGHMLFWDAFDELVAVLRPHLGLAG